ncbi:MAG: hypothetical protein KAJ24_04150, partial [Candidatus Aenigmarchaeota archaeon]|nr:hypothetical protein [Candidatus Aenigmarchaeota archaeon]
VATPENWSFIPYNFSYSTILKNASSAEDAAELYVPPATVPGYYYVNFTLNWTNLDGTNETSVLQVPVYVAPNPVVDIVEQNITIVVGAGNSSQENMTVNSTGNAPLSAINFNCTAGDVCANFTIDYIPSNITSLEEGNSSVITVNVSIPAGYAPAIYNGTLRAYTESSYDEATLFVLIPLDLSWQHTPTYLGMDVVQGMNGTLGTVDVENTGNIQLLLLTSITGNSSYFGANSSSLTIDSLDEESVLISYYAPEATSIQEYTAYFKTTNTSTSPSEHDTLLNITVYPLHIGIESPTTAAPATNIDAGENITIIVNATYAAAPVITGLEFNANLSDEATVYELTILAANYNASDSLWYLDAFAPALATGKAYDLSLATNYTPLGFVITERQNNSVVYTDYDAPVVSIYAPSMVSESAVVTIYMNITESGGIKNKTLQVTNPLSSTANVPLNTIGQVQDTYMYYGNFTNTLISGVYTIYAESYDQSDNYGNATGSFEVRSTVVFAGIARNNEDPENPGIPVTFSFYRDGEPSA